MAPEIRFLQTANYETIGLNKLFNSLGILKEGTIPKWTQRGFMDPLDSFLSSLAELAITVAEKSQL